VQASLRLNDGQCLPISSIVQAAVDTIRKNHIQPEDAALFINAICQVACNLPQYPLLAKRLLRQQGEGFDKVQVYATEYNMMGLPLEAIYDIFCGFLLGGLMRKMGCKLRPYELNRGQTDQVLAAGRLRLHQCIAAGGAKDLVFNEIVAELARIPLAARQERRPKVAIIGDLYVQDNDVFNQKLIANLESYGAEVLAVPTSYTVRLMAAKANHTLTQNGHYFSLLQRKILAEVAEKFEVHFYKSANTILNEEAPSFDDWEPGHLEKYNLSLDHDGETAQNVLKIFSLLKHYPDIALFVHVNPIFCCPALVSESLFKTIEKDIGIPIVSIIYDGTTAEKNELLAPYMHYIRTQNAARAL
jgi:predicted nucleotide-binding protein (sugar kinase/HSP70/actin superfamily)